MGILGTSTGRATVTAAATERTPPRNDRLERSTMWISKEPPPARFVVLSGDKDHINEWYENVHQALSACHRLKAEGHDVVLTIDTTEGAGGRLFI